MSMLTIVCFGDLWVNELSVCINGLKAESELAERVLLCASI